MHAQTAVVIGSTGLIGMELLQLLLNDPDYSTVRILVRQPVATAHQKLDVQIVTFDDYHDIKEKLGSGHSVFCCVGTTMKKVKGNKEAYRKVDYNIPVNAANAAVENGFKKYLLVSSVGANRNSGNFYLQLKGLVEDVIAKLEFESIHFFRPSVLLGNRKESRPAEKIAQGGMKILSIFLLGRLRNYKPIRAIDVAKAMIKASKSFDKGVFMHHFEEMVK